MNKRILHKIKHNSIPEYCIAFIIGLAIGFGYVPITLAGVIYISLGAVALFFAFQSNIKSLFSVLPYMIYSEIYMRQSGQNFPYLFIQYLLIGVFVILILKQETKVKIHSRAFILLILFFGIEAFNSYRSADAIYTRGLILNTLVLTVVATWGSINFLTPAVINKFLDNVKMASIFLCGFGMVRQFTGGISYGLSSMSESVNGLAPVQLSGYLGFSCSLFFLSVMNDDERKNLLVNIVLLCLTSSVMLLSFSRGGIYFLGVVMLLFFIFNYRSVKSYYLFLLIIPAAFTVYFYVTKTTNGAIEERYAQEGSAGRNLLVEAGFKLLIQEPIAGVGTGNFNSEIKNRDLYSGESGAHNEFVRVAAEHGVLGILTYWGFYIFLFIEILGRRKIQRDYGIYFFVLFCMIIVHNGLKISIQPMILMLVVATPSIMVVKKKLHVRPVTKFI